MRYLAIFLQKDPFKDFAIQEFLSLASLYNVKTEGIFKSAIGSFSPRTVSYRDFVTYPYVELDVEAEDAPKLKEILNQAVCTYKIMQILAGGPSEEDFKASFAANYDNIRAEEESSESYAFRVDAHFKSLTRAQQMEKISTSGLSMFKGRCDLTSPDRVFLILENYNIKGELIGKYFGTDIAKNLNPKSKYFRYNLSDRPFLGPTSTDSDLAFMMVNQAKVCRNALLFDPFVGTGSILIAGSALGAVCFGSEIDIRVLNGYGVGRLNKQSPYKNVNNDRVDVFLNFKYYNLQRPEICRLDSVATVFNTEGFFDAIVCDPPYGIRASARESGTRHGKPISKTKDNIIPTKITNCISITDKLFGVASNVLKVGGRLVFLFPCIEGERMEHIFEKYDNFDMVCVSENIVSSKFVRLLYTFEKVK